MNISKSIIFFAAGLLSDLITGIQIVTAQFKYVEKVQKVLMHKTNLQTFMQKKNHHTSAHSQKCVAAVIYISK